MRIVLTGMKIILTGIDENPDYWDRLIAFMASVDKNCPGVKVYPYLLNRGMDDYEKLEKFKCFIGCALPPYVGSAYQKNYYRHTHFQNVFCRYFETLAWIDADCIVRGNIDKLFSVKDNEIAFWERPHKKIEYKFQGGVYSLGCSVQSYRFCDVVEKLLRGKDDWTAPQKIMWERLPFSSLKIKKLSKKYNDSDFEDDSHIWHIKHSRRDNEKAKKEFEKYLKIGKEIIGE